MIHNIVVRTVLLVSLTGLVMSGLNRCSPVKQYEPNWESLEDYPVANWFQDAKFGIYTHWGIYSVPAFRNEWYPRHVYLDVDKEDIEEDEGNRARFHRENFGDLSEFGYKDFIPRFTGENFDADEWAELFKKAGARFAGPVAEHHDGFAMWDTRYRRWNATQMGPKRNIVSELETAIKKRGMKFVTSFHHAFNWEYYPVWDTRFDVSNPEYSGLYGTIHEKDELPNQEFLDEWYGKLIEVIDKYSPDLMWFDFALNIIPDELLMKYIAYYYNHAANRDKTVVVTYKHHDLPTGVAVVDLERGRMDQMTYHNWLTDTSIGWRSWGYIKEESFKDTNSLIDVLIDIVSKNGCMLLSLGPKPDGTIPEEAQNRLLEMGEWLKINGEAIYGTQPWKTYGIGPTRLEQGGGFNEDPNRRYTGKDIRFTTRDRTLYAICLDWPGEQMTIPHLIDGDHHMPLIRSRGITSVTLVGDGQELDWQTTEEGLVIRTPENKPCEYAFVFKIVR